MKFEKAIQYMFGRAFLALPFIFADTMHKNQLSLAFAFY